MENQEFITFQKFNEQTAAIDFGILLNENNIEYLLEDYSMLFDPTYSNNELTKEFRIKIKKQDFEKVDELLMQISPIDLGEIDTDYYLLSFSDDELFEVVSKKDEWGSFDYLLAQKLLKERGKEVNYDMLKLLKNKRLEELTKPEENQKNWIFGGYVFAFLGGVLGIFIGWHLLTHKKTLPNGDRVYAFTEHDRKEGNRILIIGLVFFFIWLSFNIIGQFYS